MSEETEYKRVLLKVSGEALMGDGQYGIDVATVDRIASEVKDALSLGVEVCMVIGGGNIFRGLSGAADGMDRASADYMGMLATIMNALAMQNGLERLGVPTRVLSAIPMTSVCEPYIRRPCHPPYGKSPRGYFCRRNRQPVFHNRYSRCVAGSRNEL